MVVPLTADELEKIIKSTDDSQNRIDIIMDSFLGEFPREEGIKRVVESELIHPEGYGTLRDVEELTNTVASEWASDNTPSEYDISDPDAQEWYAQNYKKIVSKLTQKYLDTFSEDAEEVYKSCLREWTDNYDDRYPTVHEKAEKTAKTPTVEEANELIQSNL